MERVIPYVTLSKALEFMGTVGRATVDAAIETAKNSIEFERKMNEVGNMFENVPAPVHCPCRLSPFEEMVDTEFIIPISKNDTPASIAEAIVNKIKGVTMVDTFNSLNNDIEEE